MYGSYKLLTYNAPQNTHTKLFMKYLSSPFYFEQKLRRCFT